MTSTTASQDCSSPIWLGRQPIVDSKKRLVAYEVLYRSTNLGPAAFSDGNQATSAVLVNTFVELGFDQVVDDRIAFMNFTREFLTGEYPLPECPKRLVLEVLEDVVPDAELIQGLERLRSEGYKIALDDVVYHPSLEPLLELATFVKVELPQIPQDQWAEHVKTLRQWPVILLAEKIETQEEFELCRELGFDLFQGYFLSKPEIIEGRKLDGNQLALMKILAEINSPAADIKNLANTVEQDPALCIKLLKYVNSSHFAVRRNVESLQHACVMLGLESLRTITTLLLLAGNQHIPQQTARTALLRAWMCRSLAKHHEGVNAHSLFTTGLLSMLDVLMGQPLETLLAALPLDESILNAILRGEGVLGQILQTVLSYENCDWSELTRGSANPHQLRSAYFESVEQVKQAWTASA
jgi:EAL and modified HD-GYP domain-containing signal transduction protein